MAKWRLLTTNYFTKPMNTTLSQKYYRYSVINLLIVAILGTLMRYKMVQPSDFEQTYYSIHILPSVAGISRSILGK